MAFASWIWRGRQALAKGVLGKQHLGKYRGLSRSLAMGKKQQLALIRGRLSTGGSARHTMTCHDIAAISHPMRSR